MRAVYIGLKRLKFLFIITVLIILSVLSSAAFSRLFPIKYSREIRRYSAEYGLRESFVYAVINAESRFDASAVSEKGASGLMQLRKITADWGADELSITGYDYSRVLDPDISVRIGCWYLARLIRQYGDERVALAAYNAGSGNVSGWLADERYSSDGRTLDAIPFSETEKYITKVMRNERVYRILLKLRSFTTAVKS